MYTSVITQWPGNFAIASAARDTVIIIVKFCGLDYILAVVR